jgi:UDP:flavonoid glycosyltransferase YjiC (YdhE family)
MRWLLTSWGSRGDVHPFLALGLGLKSRGHEVTLVGPAEWETETVTTGIRFVATGEPRQGDLLRRHPEIMSTRWGGIPALHALVKHGIAPGLPEVLTTLLAEAPRHDVLVAHHFVLPAPVVAELANLPWATVSLAPGVVPSVHARPASHFSRPGRGFLDRRRNAILWAGGKFATRAMIDPLVNRMRRERGLRPIRGAVFDAHSPQLNLQLYSRHFAPPPPDWSGEKRQAGFCFYTPVDAALPSAVENFLRAGESPILFTLGSAAVHAPGAFYRDAVAVLAALRLRGILLIGPEENRPASLPESILAIPDAPYALLMPRVRAVVHQCGIGTLSHTLRAGVPSVAWPFAFDQPNNARRLEALGVAEVILPGERSAAHLERALRRLLAGEAPARARQLGKLLREEDGVSLSCDILEEIFGH